MRAALPLLLLLLVACSDAPTEGTGEAAAPSKVEMVSVTATEVLATVRQLDAKAVVLNFWQTT